MTEKTENKDLYMQRRENLPVIALRGMWLFPNNIQQIEVGRQISLNAINAAMLRNSQVFITSQKDSLDETISIDNCYEIGVVADIKQTYRLANGNLAVLVEGLERASINSLVDNDNFIEAEVNIYEYQKENYEPKEQTKAIIRMIASSFEDYSQALRKNVTAEINMMLEEEDYSKLVDNIAMLISLNAEYANRILSILDVDERVEKVYEMMVEEIEFIQIRQDIERKISKEMNDSQREYFLQEEMKMIRSELGDEFGYSDLDDYKKRIEGLKLDEESQDHLLKELSRLEVMNSNNPESTVIRTYLDEVLEIPWNKKSKSRIDLNKAEDILEKSHYGLKNVKERILEYLAVKKLTGSLKGPILCLVGPPGVGKTSIARSIAKATGRKFVSMRLGGLRDEAEIRGHRKTYIGAMPGRIVESLQRAKTMNPVFLLDEIDKLAADYKGDPSSSLLEVLDPEQNDEFKDNYIEIAVDLSDVLFITTANSIDPIPDALRDRMEIIEVNSYTDYEKYEIANRYLIPKQLKENGLRQDQFHITKEAIYILINNYTRESGVRELERTIGKLVRKAVLKVSKDKLKKVSVNKSNIEKYLGPLKFLDEATLKEDTVGVVNGLAWTRVGGVILNIEASVMEGSGKTQLTGQLGDVMKESAMAAISYVRKRQKDLGIEGDFYKDKDIHIHVPEGAVPKDGPSAGVTMVTALVSALTGRKVKKDYAMTGEISLTGRVMPIGGVKEKVLAAHRYGIDKIFLPEENKRDVEEIDADIRKKINFYYVKDVSQILDEVLV
ncbi:MAG: endopeptidase La [Finegoldia sp.]|nr:endopeptidase La [Finegoldia sp.]